MHAVQAPPHPDIFFSNSDSRSEWNVENPAQRAHAYFTSDQNTKKDALKLIAMECKGKNKRKPKAHHLSRGSVQGLTMLTSIFLTQSSFI